MRKYLLVALLIAWSSQVFSEDIDLYVNNTSSNVQRPSVLIILDNSPSMNWYPVDNNHRIGWPNEHVNNPDTRAHVAREIVIDLINENPEVDFALQLFNSNGGGQHGGRIVFGFKDLSVPANKSELISILDTDTDNTNNNYTDFAGAYTPLCETLYETYLYLSGGEILYGDDDDDVPQSIISSGDYTSPFKDIECNKEVTIIYITDGDPTGDSAANDDVDDLPGMSTGNSGNRLGALGSWMATRNWNTSPVTAIADTSKSDILASVKIHTVGFGGDISATALLELAARDGVAEVVNETSTKRNTPAGGKYHRATTADALKTALEAVVIEAMQSSTLTSASVSANGLDRTQTLDAVYYGMFEPSTAARWSGNLKKYKIVNGEQVDVSGSPAVNSVGEFDENAQSFWSADVDGNDVNKGGVAEMLREMATEDRRFLTDIGGNVALSDFGFDEIVAAYATAVLQTALFEIPLGEVGDIPEHIQWAMGVDVDDDSATPTVRPDVFGDPLHSKPVVVTYAGSDGDDTRIVVGTNAGVLHMFRDITSDGADVVTESWAYLPREFFKNIKPLRQNIVAPDNKIYGLDGGITLYINESDGNGRVDDGDTAWLFFGLRRGGRSYYALDITDPDEPALLWHISGTATGANPFSDLGQTWSKPQVVRSAFNAIEDEGNLVVIFGGGYDTAKDAEGPNAHADTKGAAVYIVNAISGALIVEIPTGNNNGIASSIASLDSDRDSLVDRLYVGDTGGSVWRIDMPDATSTNTSIIELASLAEGLDDNANTYDRRFFHQPSIARTYILETTNIAADGSDDIIVSQQIPYDAILLGSGDKATPTAIDTKDMFFMIKDRYIQTQRLDQIEDLNVITLADLSDYTDDPFNGYPTLTPDQEANLLTVSSQSGWHFDLRKPGEKTSAEAIVISNTVYFTTYNPAEAGTCSVTPGSAWLYAVDLAFGFKKYNWSEDEGNIRGDRIKNMGSHFLGKPTLISTLVTDDDDKTHLQGNLIIGKTVLPVGFNLQTMRTSLTSPEATL